MDILNETPKIAAQETKSVREKLQRVEKGLLAAVDKSKVIPKTTMNKKV